MKIHIHRYQAKAEGKVRLATGQALACAPEREVNQMFEYFIYFSLPNKDGKSASTFCVKVVGARVSELPAWVFFPDVERVEWVNR